MIDENTGEEPRCLLCGSSDGCEHIVADIDLTFNDCCSGALYNRLFEFRSLIHDRFLAILKERNPPAWQNDNLAELWRRAKEDYDGNDDAFQLDGYLFYSILIGLLIGAGAIEHPGSIVDYGGPGMTSSVSLLFADEPEIVVDQALEKLKQIFA